MSKMVELNLRPDESTLRQFGFIALGGFGLLAACAWFEWLMFSFGLGEWKQPVAIGFAGLAGVATLFSLVYPKANLPIFVGLSIVAFPIGFVLSHLILGALFFGLIGPVAIFFRITGRDPMQREYDPDADSYWSDPRPARPSDDYFRQF
jgi:hypothetical protein